MENQIISQAQEAYTSPSKANSEALYLALIDKVKNGQIDPFLALAQLTAIEKAVSQAIDDVRLFYALPLAKDAPVKTFEKYGVQFQYKETSKTDYSCHLEVVINEETGEEMKVKVPNTKWVELNNEVIAAKKELDKETAALKIDGKFVKTTSDSLTVILK